MTRRSSAQRLARLLAIVPWVVAHDGPLVSEVCERFRISERELIADLNLLFMCGVYPYTPDALIEVDLEGGRVWVRFAEWFRRPLRLERAGGPGAGRCGAGHPRDAGYGQRQAQRPGQRRGQARDRARGGRGRPARDRARGGFARPARGAPGRGGREPQGPARLLLLRPGRDRDARCAAVAGVLLRGALVPAGVVREGASQASFPRRPGRSATLLDDYFEPPDDLGPVPVYESRSDDPVVTLDLAPDAHWVVERYPHEGTVDMGEGVLRARLRVSSKAWLERVLLRAGPSATVVSGADGMAAGAARRILAAYGHVTSRE